MLILTRKRGESVDLVTTGADGSSHVFATITLLGLLPNGVVRLGFNADPSVRILRDNIGGKQMQRSMDNDYEETATEEDETPRGNCRTCDED